MDHNYAFGNRSDFVDSLVISRLIGLIRDSRWIGWYFWDEAWTELHGPYTTREVCVQELNKYADSL